MDRDICPQADRVCDVCLDRLRDENPHNDVFRHTFHTCGCDLVENPPDDFMTTHCIACGERRDLFAEWDRFWAGRPTDMSGKAACCQSVSAKAVATLTARTAGGRRRSP